MFEHIKSNIFTIHGIITTLIHLFLVVGFVTCWVTFQVHVLGNRPSAPWGAQAPSHSTPTAKGR
jgi:hypothetical protein